MLARGALVVAVLACGLAAFILLATRLGDPAPVPAPAAAPPATAPAAGALTAGDGASPLEERATVVGVADPVTLDVRLPAGEVVRVRALGIQPAGDCYADQGVAFARRVLGTVAVRLVPDATGPATDPFDRRLVHVVLEGSDAEYAVLAAEAGVARTYSAGASEAAMPPVRDAERRAREAGRGLWAGGCVT